MRVALLTNFIPPYRLSFFQAVAERVADLRIFVSTPMERSRDWKAEWGNLDVVVQKTLTIPGTWTDVNFRERIEVHVPLDTRRLLRGYRPDVIVTGELGARSLGAVRHARRRGLPVALWLTLADHLESVRGLLRRSLRAWILDRVQVVFVNGTSGARYVRRFNQQVKLLTIPYTTRLTPFRALSLERPRTTPFTILCVGSLTQRKAPHLMLHAARYAAERGWHLRLVFLGGGPLRAPLERESKRSPAALEVLFAGNVAYADLPAWYGLADLVAFPTLGDEWGVVVNEALGAGVPVLGSKYSQAVEELIRHGTNGWICDPMQPGRMCALLEEILELGPEPAFRMRLAARESSQAVDHERIADRFVEGLRLATTAGRESEPLPASTLPPHEHRTP